MDCDITGQLVIIYSAFVKYLGQNKNKMGQCIGCLHTSRKLMIQVGGKSCMMASSFVIRKDLVRLMKVCLNET